MLQGAVKAALPHGPGFRKEATWLPRDIRMGASEPPGDSPRVGTSPAGTPVSSRMSREESLATVLHTGYSSEGSNADLAASHPGTPASSTQVRESSCFPHDCEVQAAMMYQAVVYSQG